MPATRGAKDENFRESAPAYAAAVPAGGPGRYAYLSLLGLRSVDTAGLVKRLEKGISYAAFEKLKNSLQVSSRELADVALITPRTLARRKKAGRMQSAESDRLVRLARVFSRAIELFEGNSEGALEWMKRSSRALGGPSPFEMAKTEVGAAEVERLIDQLEHGVVI